MGKPTYAFQIDHVLDDDDLKRQKKVQFGTTAKKGVINQYHQKQSFGKKYR